MTGDDDLALRKIRKIGDNILLKVSKPVENVDDKIRQLLDDMLETMYDVGGAGLAAVQVGVLRRVAVVDTSEERNNPIELINPQIISSEDSQEDWEGCLSIPGQTGLVERPMVTVVQALNRNGREFEHRFEGRAAVCVNHELDHLDGVLYTTKAKQIQRDEDSN